MNRASYVYLSCPVIMTLASIAAGITAPPKSDPHPDIPAVGTVNHTLLNVPAPMVGRIRRWRSPLLPSSTSFRVDRASGVTRILSSAGSLFVLSHAAQTVLRYSPAGDLLKVYRFVPDRHVISDITVTKAGIIWAADSNGRTLALTLDGRP